MIRVLLAVILVFAMAVPTQAQEWMPPEVPRSGAEYMPEHTESFGEAMLELIQKGIRLMRPDLQEAAGVCAVILFSAILFSVLPSISSRLRAVSELTSIVLIFSVMFQHTNSMILLASDTVNEIFEYGKLLSQIMTAALAAQGGTVSSSSLYIGTTVFISLLGSLISRIVIPMTCFYLVFAVAYCAIGDEMLKRIADAIKGLLIWSLKTLMIVFTTYMSVTGVVSGTTDAAVLKSAKVVISSVVPVVGGILSDSSDAVLTSMAVVKNAAGIYGMLAVMAVFIGPFLRIGAHYIMLRASSLLCGVLGNKRISEIAEYLSGAMSILLASVASGCFLVLISTVCFLKGAA